MIRSRHDRGMHAQIVHRRPLIYDRPADPLLDRPDHVRAGSGLTWYGNHLAIVQDDANFVALIDVHSGHCTALTLPAGFHGRRQFDDSIGNKADKYDFETIVEVAVVTDVLLLIGSGSTPTRESIAIIEPTHEKSPDVRIIHVPAFYHALRSVPDFSGSELNIEGALQTGTTLRLFGRGNGAPRADRNAVDATCDIDVPELIAFIRAPELHAAPQPFNVTQYDLGEIAGQRLSFTDATLVPAARARPHAVAYTATAEASPDAVRDGTVSGSALGIITYESDRPEARWTEILDENGERLIAKTEGIVFDRTTERIAWIVLDVDSHDVPSELCKVQLSGL